MGLITDPVLICDACDALILPRDKVARVLFETFLSVVPGVEPWTFYDPTENEPERVYHVDCALAMLDEDEDCDDPACCGTGCDDACCETAEVEPAPFGFDPLAPSFAGHTDCTGI